MILWAGDRQRTPGQSVTYDDQAIPAWIGAAITPDETRDRAFRWLVKQPEFAAVLELGSGEVALRMPGWTRYDELKRTRIESRFAFMAMQFGDEQLDAFFVQHLVGAVARTGFELRRIIDRQPAGLIDDQMRTAIRTSRFVIAELTHENRGAYWEAGFGEGAGKPVIYMCRDQEWKSGSSHFDTNHLNTVIWKSAQLEAATEKLVAMIRATFPDEAILEG